MMLLLTPIGLGDPCIEGLPNLEDAVPNKSEVTVLVCMDGKNDTAQLILHHLDDTSLKQIRPKISISRCMAVRLVNLV